MRRAGKGFEAPTIREAMLRERGVVMVPGIHAILYAMFDCDERLDRSAMRRQIEISIAAGAHGICALGLATEVAKLREDERRQIMAWVAEDVARRVPVGFTIYGNSVAEQCAQAKSAEAAGADWIILQPPTVGAFFAAEYIRFFGRVADATGLAVAIQNAPAYFGGRGLSATEFAELVRQHPNVKLMKGEASAVDIKPLIDVTGGRVPVLNGRGGLELVDNLRAGCAGFILAPDLIDRTVEIYRRFASGDESGAETLYAEILPTIVFMMQSLEALICYGKRVFAARAGLEVFDRAPALRPSEFGLQLARRHAARLGSFSV